MLPATAGAAFAAVVRASFHVDATVASVQPGYFPPLGTCEISVLYCAAGSAPSSV